MYSHFPLTCNHMHVMLAAPFMLMRAASGGAFNHWRSGLETSLLLLYDFTLEAREQNLTFPRVTKPPSKGVIDSIESLLWHMSVFVDFQVSWRTSNQSEKVKQYLCRPGSSCTPLGRPVNKHCCLSSQALIKQPPLLHPTVKLPQRAGGEPSALMFLPLLLLANGNWEAQ